MTKRYATVLFRGVNVDVVIDADGGPDPKTNSHEVQWRFDGLNAEEHADLRITDAERDYIQRQLCHRETDEG